MQRLSIVLSSLVIAIGFTVVGCNKMGKADLNSDKGKVSYAYGYQVGRQLKAQEAELDMPTFVAAVEDQLSGKEPQMKEEDMRAAFGKAMEAAQKKRVESGVKNKEAGDAFLAQNKSKPDVKTTASGLQYKMIQDGSGKNPTADDVVEVHYRGRLIDGKEFDSSYKRNEPAKFPVGGVIPGWKEGIQLMKPGSKYELYIPSDLAYGEQGAGSDIPPNSALIFEVELLKIVDMPASPDAAPKGKGKGKKK